jgi:hypothetical protein
MTNQVELFKILCIKARKIRPLAMTFLLSNLALLGLTVSLRLCHATFFLFLLVLSITDRLILTCSFVDISYASQHCVIADEGGGACIISVQPLPHPTVLPLTLMLAIVIRFGNGG